MATDLTARLDEETKKAQASQAAPVQPAAPQPVPTLGVGLQGMSRVISESGVEPPAISGPTGRIATGVITADSIKGIESEMPSGKAGPAGTTNIYGSIDMKGVNDIMARENKARGEMIDLSIKANGGNGVAVLPDYQPPQQGGISISDIQSAMKSAGTRTERAAYGQMLNTVLNNQVQQRGQDLSHAAEIGRQGVTVRGQDLNAQSDLARSQILLRGQDISANTDAQRLGLDRSRLEMAGADQSRAAEKWGIERGILQGQAADSEMVRTARAELTAAINSGDPAKVEAAKAKAVAAGVKFDKPNNEFTAVTDSMGLNVTRTNKDTGAVDIINPKTGEVKSIPAPGTKPAASQAPVPQGYSVVGTSGGKRVLQDAKGNRFVEGQ